MMGGGRPDARALSDGWISSPAILGGMTARIDARKS